MIYVFLRLLIWKNYLQKLSPLIYAEKLIERSKNACVQCRYSSVFIYFYFNILSIKINFPAEISV